MNCRESKGSPGKSCADADGLIPISKARSVARTKPVLLIEDILLWLVGWNTDPFSTCGDEVGHLSYQVSRTGSTDDIVVRPYGLKGEAG